MNFTLIRRLKKFVPAVVVICSMLLGASTGYAGSPFSDPNYWPTYTNPFPDFFQLARPGHAELTLISGGYGSDKYGTVQEGFQFEQSVTRYLGVVGRVLGYQIWEGDGFDNPLNPGTGHRARLNMGRLEGGLDFAPFQGTHFFIFGGHDVGDSTASVIEGDFTTWLFLHSHHPVNFLVSITKDFENGILTTEMDLRDVVMSTENYLVLAGAGGAFYREGFVSSVEGQAGPIVSVYSRVLRGGVDLQAGYGSAHQYAQISFYKQFGWTE